MSKLSRLNWCHSIDAKFYPKNLFDSFREMISIYLEKNSSKNEGKNIDKKNRKKIVRHLQKSSSFGKYSGLSTYFPI